jgi:hypothetical protein
MSTTVVESPAPSLPLKKDDSILPPEVDSSDDESIPGIRFVDYVDESQLDQVMSLVGRDLSEPYSSKYLPYWWSLRFCIRSLLELGLFVKSVQYDVYCMTWLAFEFSHTLAQLSLRLSPVILLLLQSLRIATFYSAFRIFVYWQFPRTRTSPLAAW